MWLSDWVLLYRVNIGKSWIGRRIWNLSSSVFVMRTHLDVPNSYIHISSSLNYINFRSFLYSYIYIYIYKVKGFLHFCIVFFYIYFTLSNRTFYGQREWFSFLMRFSCFLMAKCLICDIVLGKANLNKIIYRLNIGIILNWK